MQPQLKKDPDKSFFVVVIKKEKWEIKHTIETWLLDEEGRRKNTRLN